jgi:pyruvate-formate lyase-activating enzyme
MKTEKIGKEAEIFVNTDIFPIPLVVQVMNDFIKDHYIFLKEKSSKRILLKLIPKKGGGIGSRKLENGINRRLISSFVQDSNENDSTIIKNIITQVMADSCKNAVSLPQTSKREKKRAFIVLTRKCINDCLFCSEKLRMGWPVPSNKEVKEILDKDCKSFSHIVFSGGEPGLREDICELIEYAKDLGYSVTLFSNGRLFSNLEFAKRVATAGLESILIPLHGYPPEIHDAITQQPKSFEQTVSGIKNLASFNVKVIVKIIPNKINYKSLGQLAFFVSSLSASGYTNTVAFDMLSLVGSALKNKDIISTKLSNMAPYIEEAIDVLTDSNNNIGINVNSLPLCLIDRKYWKYIQNSRLKEEIKVGLNEKKITVPSYTGQTITPSCKGCIMQEKCPGTWPTYFEVYGDKELKPIV